MLDLFSPIRLRQDHERIEATARTIGLCVSGQPGFLGQVVAISKLPTSTGVYYAVNPVSVLGTEAEGNSAVLVVDSTTTVLVCVVGSMAPVLGDNLVCRYIENRWVAERYGANSGGSSNGASIPGCSCTSIPSVLHMSTSGPCDSGAFQPCILQYGPTPASLSGLNLGAKCFLSTQSFLDPYTGTNFLYTIGCNTIFFVLSRVYLASGSSSVYHDSTIYSWSIGLPGNTCSPFLLSNGYIFSGGNLNCLVTISQ